MAYTRVASFEENPLIITSQITKKSLKIEGHVTTKGSRRGLNKIPKLKSEYKGKDILAFFGPSLEDQFLVESFNIYILQIYRQYKGDLKKFKFYVENCGQKRNKEISFHQIEEAQAYLNKLIKTDPNNITEINNAKIKVLKLMQKYQEEKLTL